MMKTFQNLIPLLLIVCISCSSDDNTTSEENLNQPDLLSDSTTYFPPVDSEDWETASLASLQWNSQKLTDLNSYLTTANSKAFIVLKNGKLVIEEYYNNATSTDEHAWNSAAKTITALTIGIAQEEGYLDINTSSSTYLGTGWSSLDVISENRITVKNHLTMTTGLDYKVSNTNCTEPRCLLKKNEPGESWFYHNAPYILLQDVVKNATGQSFESYSAAKIQQKIGMKGAWNRLRYVNIFKSDARSMARFGLLCLNQGKWEDEVILKDINYFKDMITTSQEMNPSYGYLWWLNGKNKVQLPQSEQVFNQNLFSSAPTDLIAGLGKGDQKLYIVPSQNLVVVRLGDDAGNNTLGPSDFDNKLWELLSEVMNQ
ncbi:beta-lactamase family protein [Aquimarina sp. ERC-38]|uniref:serine hydrolase domain-containing protein n=1 Tax=Aquimarina sp. ERC-38 TaxID=2949996 RepID=UPI0022479C22|nr:serine hydrolase [Aquimarina sp. ERC-38]UZO79328.1 beta-lactamase family protein [Aquimarina sp. ERC-38]